MCGVLHVQQLNLSRQVHRVHVIQFLLSVHAHLEHVLGGAHLERSNQTQGESKLPPLTEITVMFFPVMCDTSGYRMIKK